MRHGKSWRGEEEPRAQLRCFVSHGDVPSPEVETVNFKWTVNIPIPNGATALLCADAMYFTKNKRTNTQRCFVLEGDRMEVIWLILRHTEFIYDSGRQLHLDTLVPNRVSFKCYIFCFCRHILVNQRKPERHITPSMTTVWILLPNIFSLLLPNIFYHKFKKHRFPIVKVRYFKIRREVDLG